MDLEDNPDSVRIKPLPAGPIEDATLLLLAGGRSHRMGRPKALLPVAGTTLVEWLVARLGPSFDEVLIAAGPDSPLPPRLRRYRVLDDRPGEGPLAGLETGLRAAAREAVLCVACDLPCVTVTAARRLLRALGDHEAAVPRVAGRWQPTFAAYARRAAPALREALDRGERRLTGTVLGLDMVPVEGLPEDAFWNLNTPDDYARLRDEVGRDERPY